MARYIDADDIIKAIKNRFKVYHEIPCSQDDRRVQEIVGLVIRTIDEQPTADVVPKSEVERLEEELDDFTVASLAECKACGEKTRKVIEGLQKRLANAKAEVAREIFEEIEKETARVYNDFMYHQENAPMIAPYVIAFSDKIDIDIAELKKKYTGDQT